jgi:hypothetical protein
MPETQPAVGPSKQMPPLASVVVDPPTGADVSNAADSGRVDNKVKQIIAIVRGKLFSEARIGDRAISI